MIYGLNGVRYIEGMNIGVFYFRASPVLEAKRRNIYGGGKNAFLPDPFMT